MVRKAGDMGLEPGLQASELRLPWDPMRALGDGDFRSSSSPHVPG